MTELNRLQSAFKQSTYQLSNHGMRNAGVLKKAFEAVADETESDLYGTGQIIEEFQEKMAAFLGKEAAVFFPSGTMAQQIALRIWCDDKGLKKVAYHPLSHLEIHEEDGLKELHGIEAVYLTDPDRVVELKDVEALGQEVSAVLLELPQREIGGQLPSFETLEQISRHCRDEKIKLHLDGARLLEVLPYYEKSAAQICSLFDSVYISLYKGIGGIAGAILAGDEAFTKQSKVWKRRHGGDLISLYPYIVSADYYFGERSGKMGQYLEAAKQVAALFNSCYGISTLPKVPVSNMFHVRFAHPKEEIEPVIVELQQEAGIGITSYVKESGSGSCYFEVHMGDRYEEIPEDLIAEAFKSLDQKMIERFGK